MGSVTSVYDNARIYEGWLLDLGDFMASWALPHVVASSLDGCKR
jgi:hypothetical protein